MTKTKKEKKERTIRVGAGNVVSQLFFAWVFWFILVLRRYKDLRKINFELRETETSEYNDRVLETKWLEEKKRAKKAGRRPFIRNAILRAFGLRFFLNGIWKVVWEASLWFGAYWLLQETIAFVRAKSSDFVAGQMYALGFLLSSLIASVAIHQLLSQSGCLGLRVKSALMVQIFKKSLVLARIKGGAGDVVNLVSNDCTKIADAFTNLQYLWSCAVEVILILVLAFVVLGYSACPALGIVVILTPLQLYLGRLKSRTGFENTMTTSRRVHIMSEILTAIKLIKFYAWEQPFYDRISEMRAREMYLLRKNLIVNAINYMAVFCVPVIVALFCLLTYWLSGHTITSVVGFTVVSVFNTLRYPLLMAPLAVNSASDAMSALKRLDEFFSQEEITPAVRYPSPTDSDVTVSMAGATFSWDLNNESSDFSLKKMNFTARKGKLTAVVGDVGSGKSSLLAALLGQMVRVDGESKVLGSIGYVPQEAWLLNMTLRENIIFGSPFDEKRYREVIKVCALSRDISLMPNGDSTEIGERGINLSGGQRQRISLARCVYKLNDIILLDDPLSAVDQQVGKHIFTQCIKKYFREKTVIFVTHQLQYLHQCDDILVLKEGRIIEHGSFNALMSIPGGHMATLVSEHVQLVQQPGRAALNSIDENEDIVKRGFNQNVMITDNLSQEQRLNRRRLSITANVPVDNEQELLKHIEENQRSLLSVKRDSSDTRDPIRIMELNRMSTITHDHDGDQEEEEEEDDLNPSDSEPMKLVQEDQSVNYKKSPILSYLRAGNGLVLSILLYMFFFLVHGVRIGSDYWLSQWFAKASGMYKDITDAMFVGIYGGACVLFVAGILSRGLLFAFDSTKKGIELHSKMFKSVIYAQMSFFDTTPIGRILNAFARHQYAVDAQLADTLMQLLQYTPLCMGAIILCMTVMYQTIGVFGGAAIVATLIILFVGKTEERLRNKEAVTKSTIFSHLTATLEGLYSIRAYQCEDRFVELYCKKVDENHTFMFGVMEVKCWTAFYLDVLVSFMIYTTVEVVVLTFNQYPASTSGLVLSNVLQLLVFFQWAVRMFGEVREKLGSIKQITYYGNCVKQEALPIIEDSRPPENWPTRGNIKFDSVVLKYQEFGVAVLKGVTINIKPKEKIGIVGRTGSGKSTLLISLLRIVEAAEGKIIIDGLDVSKFGLKDLRSRIAIIPQEPILFVGTIRENVDLFQKNTDEEIWKALDSVHLGNFIRKLDQKLDSLVIENGKNFSVGQRQLFCIARAILSKTQILVLDEATAAVDLQTDKLIQDTIKENFANLTVLTIAHRLNTIMESDKILVMDAGRVIEFAPPVCLLERPNGAFYSLLKETGPASFNKLKKVAFDSAIKKQNLSAQLDPRSDPDNIIIDMKTLEDQLKIPSGQQQPISSNVMSQTLRTNDGMINQAYVMNETSGDPVDQEKVYVSVF